MSWQEKLIELTNSLDVRVHRLESEVETLKNIIKSENLITRTQIVRVKNKEFISNESILNGTPYNDLTPDKAYSMYNDPNTNYIIVDVSDFNFKAPVKLKNALKIPLKDLPYRFLEASSRTIPILIISENGVNSILACEFFIEHGFYNVINVSGGYKFWPAARLQEVPPDLSQISA